MPKIKHLQFGQSVEELREWKDTVIIENNLRVFTKQPAEVCNNEIILKVRYFSEKVSNSI